MAYGQVPDFSAPFIEERDKARQQVSEEAAQAAALAEMLGFYTPELQQRVTQPLGYNPSAGESLLGAPVRGLGRILGSERLQQVGAPRAFDIGQAPFPQQQFGQMEAPPIPAGTDPETKELLNALGMDMGLKPHAPPKVTPSLPSEASGTPRLKTKRGHDMETAQQTRLWELYIKNYQTEQEREQIQSEIDKNRAYSEYLSQTGQAAVERARRPANVTEAGLIKDSVDRINEERTQQGLKPILYTDMIKSLKAASKNPTARIQMYNLMKEKYGYVGTLLDFERDMKRAGWDPIQAAHKMFFAPQSTLPFDVPHDEWNEYMARMASEMAESIDVLDEEMKARGETGLMSTYAPIPQSLKDAKVTETDIFDFMQEFGVPTRDQAIEMMLNVQKRQEEMRKQ